MLDSQVKSHQGRRVDVHGWLADRSPCSDVLHPDNGEMQNARSTGVTAHVKDGEK